MPLTREHKTLIHSLATEAASPATESDLHAFSLCRVTGRSSENLKALAAQVGGHWGQFREALGLRADTRHLHGHPSDQDYWRLLCAWLRIYIPQFEQKVYKMAEELALPDASAVTEQMATALGIDTNFLQYYLSHKTSIRDFVVDIRSELGTMAELKLFTLIAQGDPATVRWALPRLNPQIYNLNHKKDDDEDDINVIFG